MPCPECGSNSLWDDLMWWGCNDCGWMNGGNVYNKSDPKDRFDAPEEKESNGPHDG